MFLQKKTGFFNITTSGWSVWLKVFFCWWQLIKSLSNIGKYLPGKDFDNCPGNRGKKVPFSLRKNWIGFQVGEESGWSFFFSVGGWWVWPYKTTRWLNEPIWKVCSSSWIISPRFAEKIKHIWNHLHTISPNQLLADGRTTKVPMDII